MIDVVVAYDRSAAAVIEEHIYVDQFSPAWAKRLELELAYRKRLDVEVVLVSACAFDDLKISHARYFDPDSIHPERHMERIKRLVERMM